MQLLPPTYLSSGQLQKLLQKLHDVKQRKVAGTALFNSVIAPVMRTCHVKPLPDEVHTMIWLVLAVRPDTSSIS